MTVEKAVEKKPKGKKNFFIQSGLVVSSLIFFMSIMALVITFIILQYFFFTIPSEKKADRVLKVRTAIANWNFALEFFGQYNYSLRTNRNVNSNIALKRKNV